MKKTRMDLRKKLLLNKEVLGSLTAQEKQMLQGGATDSACQLTKVPDLCKGRTVEYGCTTHSLGIACTVIFCV